MEGRIIGSSRKISPRREVMPMLSRSAEGPAVPPPPPPPPAPPGVATALVLLLMLQLEFALWFLFDGDAPGAPTVPAPPFVARCAAARVVELYCDTDSTLA